MWVGDEHHHPITGRQYAILTFVATYQMEHGWSPSIREIAVAVGLDSTSSVAHQLNVLARRGYIKRERNRTRSISVIGGVDAILASSRTPTTAHQSVPGIGSTDWLRATRPPHSSDGRSSPPRPQVFRLLDRWLEVQHRDPRIGADMTEPDFAEDLASKLTEGAAASGLTDLTGQGFTVDPANPGIISTPPGGLYAMVFPDANRELREGILLNVLAAGSGGVIPDPGRFRDGWIERRTDDSEPVIAIYTRNGGGNRDCYCEPPNLGAGDCTGCRGERFAQHPLCIESPDDDFDSTYRTYYFTIPVEFLDRLGALAQPHVDMSVRWQAAIEAISAK